MSTALSDVKVLDLTYGVAGPFCTKVLACLGAEVIKVERPWGGDPARHAGPFLRDEPDLETSALFLDLNQHKKSITLDITTKAGRAVVEALAAEADIFVESFAPGTMQRYGLSFAALHEANPKLTYVSLTGFGQTGPYRDYQTADVLYFAMGGEMFATGLPERSPVRLASFVMSCQGGNVAAAAALMAHHGARHGGPGQRIDLSVQEVAASSPDRRVQYLVGYIYNHTVPGRHENIWAIYPTGIYPCKDGFIDIFGGGPNFFHRTCQMIGRPELLQDPRFSTGARLIDPASKQEFDSIFVPWAVERTKAEIMELAQRHSVYAAPIFTPKDVLRDRHFRERGVFVQVDHPRAGRQTYPGPAAKLTATPWRAGRAPMLGEHTEEVLVGRLGLSHRELARMRRAGAA